MSLPTETICLGRSELLTDRPFTHPEHNEQDLWHMQLMAQRLRQLLDQPEFGLSQARPWVTFVEEAGGPRQRVVLSQPEILLTSPPLTVVGFFGQKWPGADRTAIDEVDVKLLAEFPLHPNLLSYNSLELPDGNWGNLVLFDQPQGLAHWAQSVIHLYAVSELTPPYYQSIRLHHGFLTGGLMSGEEIALTRTKYYDYQTKPAWRAVREL